MQPIAVPEGGLCDGQCDLTVVQDGAGPEEDAWLLSSALSLLACFHVSSLQAGRLLHSQLVSHKPTARDGWVYALEALSHIPFLAEWCLRYPEESRAPRSGVGVELGSIQAQTGPKRSQCISW